ncbi:MAG: hypothetical protein KDA41_21710 [Planctomycetales bacterium]|nr:hypothetical protein [Planctomycetales bacterium]
MILICASAACAKSGAGDNSAAPQTDMSAYAAPAESPSVQPVSFNQGAQAAAPRNVMRFERGVIVDPTGFAQPMAVSSLFIPYGWRTQGGVFWGQQFLCTNGYNYEWSATAPDGSAGVMVLPQAKWENNDYGAPPSTPGCQSAPYTSARAWIEALAGQTFPGGRVIDYRERPDVIQQLGATPQRQQMPMGESRSWTEAGEALVAFTLNGRDMRGSVAAAVQFNLMITDSTPYGGQGRMNVMSAFAHPAWAAYAPNGQFNFGYFEAIRRSIRPNQKWSAAITGHNVAIAKVAIDESRKRAAMIAQSNEEIARIRQSVWDNQQESADRRAREFGELIRGVETYVDADAPGGTRELSANYNHAWRLNDGTYVLTDDANFDPWRDLRVEGRQLEVLK